jgi:hypothetical protein
MVILMVASGAGHFRAAWWIWCIPGPHAKSENIRPMRRLTIEATVRL